jgi:hypothetical protein
LKGILKSLGLKVSGKKKDLLNRILNKDNEPQSKRSSSSPSLKKRSPPKKKQTRLLPINNKIESQKKQIHFIKIDNFHVHEVSNLVIDPETKIIIGKYDKDTKSVININDSDIEICKQYKFRYELPDNIISKDDKKISQDKLKDKLSDILNESEEVVTEEVVVTEEEKVVVNEEEEVVEYEEVVVSEEKEVVVSDEEEVVEYEEVVVSEEEEEVVEYEEEEVVVSEAEESVVAKEEEVVEYEEEEVVEYEEEDGVEYEEVEVEVEVDDVESKKSDKKVLENELDQLLESDDEYEYEEVYE